MKRFSYVFVAILTLALLATGCSPRAVTETGDLISVKQWVFDDIIFDVGQDAVTIQIGDEELDLDDTTAALDMDSMSSLFTEGVAEWMDYAGVEEAAITYTGTGILIELNGEPFPSLAFPEGSIENTADLGVNIARNQGSYTYTGEMDRIIREVLIPMVGSALESLRFNITFRF